ncbi:unnamed protein product [Aureobasidium uvarum]|uniref:Inositol-pentakisphosphate 2-kinase n=1 Tax=Aureobasidium uvarum TaxID=2773716 RepID=A0A9N8KN76_9PEZI|nr:unnamed protein product [Aureobasidium uvarum]
MITVQYSKSPHEHIRLASQEGAQNLAILEYLAEGNANIVYSFQPITNNVLPHGLRHKLLRLRKDKSFIQPTKAQSLTFQQEFLPLFRPNNLVEQTLITLDEVLIRHLNQELEEHEVAKLRKHMRHGDRLAIDEYGLLMTDMTASHGEYLFEIKPKWLLQSPDAPEGSKRCRTCALRLQRAHAMARGAVMPKPGGFCPLSLVDVDVEERQTAFRSIIEAQAGDLSDESVSSVVTFLAEKGYQVLETLRKHQSQFDNQGVSNDYSKAMTLRDCVLFVKGSIDTFENTADIRLADMDFKHAHPDKVEKWMETERTLIDEGWAWLSVFAYSKITLNHLSMAFGTWEFFVLNTSK